MIRMGLEPHTSAGNLADDAGWPTALKERKQALLLVRLERSMFSPVFPSRSVSAFTNSRPKPSQR